MVQVVEAIFDGEVIRLDEPLPLKANTRVRVTVETLLDREKQPRSFLRTAQSLHLQGSADWSANLDGYLYENIDDTL